LTHPVWVYDYVRHGGAPTLGNWVPHAGNAASTAEVIRFGRTQTPAAAQTWRDLERYRRLFPRTLIVKGILNPADAVRAAEIGCDGVIVSNHGGRQLDQAPAPLEVLPAIKAAVGDRVTGMRDSGLAIGAPGSVAAIGAARTVDATGQIVIPGGIDPHIHSGMPIVGGPSNQELLSAPPDQVSRAALYGGTTTLLDFALCLPDVPLQQS